MGRFFKLEQNISTGHDISLHVSPSLHKKAALGIVRPTSVAEYSLFSGGNTDQEIDHLVVDLNEPIAFNCELEILNFQENFRKIHFNSCVIFSAKVPKTVEKIFFINCNRCQMIHQMNIMILLIRLIGEHVHFYWKKLSGKVFRTDL